MATDGGSLPPRSLGYFGTGNSLEPHASGGGSLPQTGTGNSLGVAPPGPSSLPQGVSSKSPLGRSTSRNSPYERTPAVRSPGGSIIVDTEHGQFLADKLDYIVPPAINSIEREIVPTGHAVFMGHMKFETTAAEVRWIVRKLTGVTPLKAEPRSKGCFLLHLASEQDEKTVRTLHRRMLMDRTGVWYARDASEAAELSDYIEHVVNPGPKRRLRLPKDCVTVETPHSTPVPPKSPQQPQQQPPSPTTGYGSRGSPTVAGPGGFPHHHHPHHHHHHQHQAPPPGYGGGASGPMPHYHHHRSGSGSPTSAPPPYNQQPPPPQQQQPPAFGRGRNDGGMPPTGYGAPKSPVGYGNAPPPPYPGSPSRPPQ